MIRQLKKLLGRIAASDGEGSSAAIAGDERRLASVALLVHAMHIDGVDDPAEISKLHEILARNYGLEHEAASALIAAAGERERQAVDLYGFTRLLVRQPLEERIGLIEMLWEMAFSDGAVDEFEDNLIWRVAELLHVDSRQRIAARRKVKAALDADEK